MNSVSASEGFTAHRYLHISRRVSVPGDRRKRMDSAGTNRRTAFRLKPTISRRMEIAIKRMFWASRQTHRATQSNCRAAAASMHHINAALRLFTEFLWRPRGTPSRFAHFPGNPCHQTGRPPARAFSMALIDQFSIQPILILQPCRHVLLGHVADILRDQRFDFQLEAVLEHLLDLFLPGASSANHG